MGSVLQFGGDDPLTLYITGDTLVHDDLREIPARHPSLDVGLWHLGATRLPGVLGLGPLVTMDGRQGADLLEIVAPRRTLPIHHGDYGVFTENVDTFFGEVQRRGLAGVIRLARGVPVALPPE
jgi:L-ascorbate metabolism protein UlaG (beta-lactamase superfamily)